MVTTTERGLGYTHQRRRRQLLPLAYGTPCPICGNLMVKGQALDLDHTLPRSRGGVHGDRITHATCNRSRGNRIDLQPTRAVINAHVRRA